MKPHRAALAARIKASNDEWFRDEVERQKRDRKEAGHAAGRGRRRV